MIKVVHLVRKGRISRRMVTSEYYRRNDGNNRVSLNTNSGTTITVTVNDPGFCQDIRFGFILLSDKINVIYSNLYYPLIKFIKYH